MQTESLIKLLAETLKFYANETNYKNDQIIKDGGVQARHILKLVDENKNTMNTYEKLFEEFVEESNKESSSEEIMNLVKKMKHSTDTYE